MEEPKTGSKHYTYADYITWNDGTRYELIDGVPYLMSAPSVEHQEAVGEIFGQLWMFLKGKPCRVFVAPFDVRLNSIEPDDTVLQPDILVVCDAKKTENGKNCEGAPDFLVEVLSPASGKVDTLLKFNRYRNAGVREYWIADPEKRVVTAFVLKDGEYIASVYGEEDKAPVSVLDGCSIDLSAVFPAIDKEEEPQ